jgi:N utilization substance protein A
VNELQGEKIDVVQWNKDPATFIGNALSPAQVLRVDLDSEEALAIAVVSDRHLSLAIGREGQNARLASSLTGWRVEIKSSVAYEVDKVRPGESTESLDEVASTPTLDGVEPVGDDVVDESPEREESRSESSNGEEVSQPIDEVPASQGKTQLLEVDQGLIPTEISEESVSGELEIEPKEESGLSPEEALLAETLAPIGESEDPKEQEIEEDRGTADDVWSIPAHSVQTSGIRFAEDILGERGPREGGRRSRGRGGKGTATPGKGKARKGQLPGTPGGSPQGT